MTFPADHSWEYWGQPFSAWFFLECELIGSLEQMTTRSSSLFQRQREISWKHEKKDMRRKRTRGLDTTSPSCGRDRFESIKQTNTNPLNDSSEWASTSVAEPHAFRLFLRGEPFVHEWKSTIAPFPRAVTTGENVANQKISGSLSHRIRER